MDFNGKQSSPSRNLFSITAQNLLPSETSVSVVELSKLREIDLLNEVVARILIESFNWAYSLPEFVSLDRPNKIASIQTCWFELFMLGFIQTEKDSKMSLVDACSAVIKHLKDTENDQIETLLATIAPSGMQLQDFVSTVKLLDMDCVEYDVLRTLCLFDKNQDQNLVRNVQDMQMETLRTHLMKKYNNHDLMADRVSKIREVLLKMQTINADIVHALFFDHLLGQHKSSVEQMIPDIVKLLSASSFLEKFFRDASEDDYNNNAFS